MYYRYGFQAIHCTKRRRVRLGVSGKDRKIWDYVSINAHVKKNTFGFVKKHVWFFHFQLLPISNLYSVCEIFTQVNTSAQAQPPLGQLKWFSFRQV